MSSRQPFDAAAERERQIQKSMATCIHYNGVMGPINQRDEDRRCKAGVRYTDLATHNVVGHPTADLYALPCLRDVPPHVKEPPVKVECQRLHYHTREEAEQRERESEEAAERWRRNLAENRCPHCGTSIDRKVQVGRCVYARPCGHRLYQGRV